MQLPRYEVGKTTIGQLVDLVANQFGASRALEYHKLGVRYDYRQFRDACDEVAKGLMALGIEKGENIAVWANNVPEWVLLQFGSGKMGAVLVTVNTNYRSFELEYLMKQSDSTTLFLIAGVREPKEYLEVVHEVCPELAHSAHGTVRQGHHVHSGAVLPLLRRCASLTVRPRPPPASP